MAEVLFLIHDMFILCGMSIGLFFFRFQIFSFVKAQYAGNQGSWKHSKLTVQPGHMIVVDQSAGA